MLIIESGNLFFKLPDDILNIIYDFIKTKDLIRLLTNKFNNLKIKKLHIEDSGGCFCAGYVLFFICVCLQSQDRAACKGGGDEQGGCSVYTAGTDADAFPEGSIFVFCF